MRKHSDKKRLDILMDEIGKKIKHPLKVYFNGGTTAIWYDIRPTTIDVDMRFEPDEAAMYQVIQELKNNMDINLELASPQDFLPELPAWRDRSIFIKKVNYVEFYHYDLYSQIIAKLQRNWKQDNLDAWQFALKDIDPDLLAQLFIQIKPKYIKFPSVDLDRLEQRVNAFVKRVKDEIQ